MTPTDLLRHLEAEGFEVSLNLKLTADEKPSDETRALIRDNRDALLEHLACELCGCSNVPVVKHLENAANYTHGYNFQNSGTLQLYGDLLLNLMVWAAQHQELRLEHPGAVVLNARAEHIREAVEAHPWGVVYDCERRVLVSWGDVPTYALMGKRDLETGELLIPEAVAARPAKRNSPAYSPHSHLSVNTTPSASTPSQPATGAAAGTLLRPVSDSTPWCA